jgi:hypothetical protein
MPIPGTAGTIHEVTVHMRMLNQEVLNVWAFEFVTSVDDIPTVVLRPLLESYLDDYLPGAGTQLTIERVSGMQVGPTLGPMYEIMPTGDDTKHGGAASDALPTHDSCCINIHTVRPGRSGRGRKFMAGIPEAATISSNIIEAHAYWLALLAFMASLDTKFIHTDDPPATNRVEIGVLSKTIAGVDKAPYPTTAFARAQRFAARPVVGTTNSRKVGRGS